MGGGNVALGVRVCSPRGYGGVGRGRPGPAWLAAGPTGPVGGSFFFCFVLFLLFIYFTFSVLVLFPIILVLVKYTLSI